MFVYAECTFAICFVIHTYGTAYICTVLDAVVGELSSFYTQPMPTLGLPAMQSLENRQIEFENHPKYSP